MVSVARIILSVCLPSSNTALVLVSVLSELSLSFSLDPTNLSVWFAVCRRTHRTRGALSPYLQLSTLCAISIGTQFSIHRAALRVSLANTRSCSRHPHRNHRPRTRLLSLSLAHHPYWTSWAFGWLLWWWVSVVC